MPPHAAPARARPHLAEHWSCSTTSPCAENLRVASPTVRRSCRLALAEIVGPRSARATPARGPRTAGPRLDLGGDAGRADPGTAQTRGRGACDGAAAAASSVSTNPRPASTRVESAGTRRTAEAIADAGTTIVPDRPRHGPGDGRLRPRRRPRVRQGDRARAASGSEIAANRVVVKAYLGRASAPPHTEDGRGRARRRREPDEHASPGDRRPYGRLRRGAVIREDRLSRSRGRGRRAPRRQRSGEDDHA